jgi:uncharacterized iron-regulated protein
MTTTIPHPAGTWLAPATGTTVPHAELMARMARQQVVLLGETHDRFDIHRWQLHVAAGLLASGRPLMLGFEMFPRRVQPALDAYVAGALDTENFLVQSEWQQVWGFDPALYLPLFQFCRQFKVPMLALNCYRALVSRVGKEGWDAIPEAERDGLTPAKPASAAHRRHLFEITGGVREGREAQSAADPAFDRFVRAQQTWDRAFACNIAAALAASPDALVIGIIGRGHMDYGHGTPFQLADLGISSVGLLVPTDTDFTPSETPIADGVFRLDTMDAAAPR